MTGHRTDRALSRGPGRLRAPDPGSFEVDVEAADDAPGWAGRLSDAADHGHLVAGRSRTVAAFGAAAVLELPRGLEDPAALAEVVGWLRALRASALPSGPKDRAPAPVAVGAFAFDPGAAATLVVPESAWCRGADGAIWHLRVRPAGGPARADGPTPDRWAAPPGHRDAGEPPGAASPARPPLACEVPPPGAFTEAVREALTAIAAGAVQKVVLSRSVEVALPSVPAPSSVLASLWDGETGYSPFSVPVPGGRLVGASPELIVARQGDEVVSHPFAGTAALDAPGAASAAALLLGSPKERAEHRFVVDAIAAALGPRCRELSVPDEPAAVRLRSDVRLGTVVRGRLAWPTRDVDAVLGLLARLHPTPAVGGVPRDAALKQIGALEPSPRGYWAGVVGWADARGDGEWVLSIRSALLSGTGATLRAGAGIVAGSEPGAELAETTLKLVPALDAVFPGAAAALAGGASPPAPGG